MDALNLLKADHQRLRDLFVTLRETEKQDERKELLDQIKDELELHSHLEETGFYPAFNEYEEMSDLVAESLEDHQEMRDIIDEIEDAEKDEDEDEVMDLWDELIDTVERHMETEEVDFFNEARQVLTEQEWAELGERLSQLKDQIGAAA